MRERAPWKHHNSLLGYQIWDSYQIWSPLTGSLGRRTLEWHGTVPWGYSLTPRPKAPLVIHSGDRTPRKGGTHQTFQELLDIDHHLLWSLQLYAAPESSYCPKNKITCIIGSLHTEVSQPILPSVYFLSSLWYHQTDHHFIWLFKLFSIQESWSTQSYTMPFRMKSHSAHYHLLE